MLYSLCLTFEDSDFEAMENDFKNNKSGSANLAKFDDLIVANLFTSDLFEDYLSEYNGMVSLNDSGFSFKATYTFRDESLIFGEDLADVPARVQVFLDLNKDMLRYRYNQAIGFVTKNFTHRKATENCI